MQITRTKLAAMLAGTVIMTAGITAAIMPDPAPAAPASAPAQHVIVKTVTVGCADRDQLTALGFLANRAGDEIFAEAFANAQATGKCRQLEEGEQLQLVSADKDFADLITADGIQLVAFASVLRAK